MIICDPNIGESANVVKSTHARSLKWVLTLLLKYTAAIFECISTFIFSLQNV